MVDKIWWFFEDFVEKLIKSVSKSNDDSTKSNQADQGVAVTRDGRIYYGKGYLDKEHTKPNI